MYRILREAFVLTDGGVGRLLADHELTSLQFDALRVLSESPGLRLSRLADRLIRDDSTLTRAVDSLVEAGWAERHPDPSDRRASLIFLTDAGHGRYQDVAAELEASLAQAWQALSATDLATFERTVGGFVDRLHQANAAG